MTIAALDPRDPWSYVLWVAGPAALFVAKLHKIYERIDIPARRQDQKDALDVLRILRAVPTDRFAGSLRALLADPVASEAGDLQCANTDLPEYDSPSVRRLSGRGRVDLKADERGGARSGR